MREHLNKQDVLNSINDVMNDRTILHKFRALRKRINRIAADVVEVKSGEWENMSEVDNAYVNTYRCSACGTTFWIDEIPKDVNYNYCPNCGAKMGEEHW